MPRQAPKANPTDMLILDRSRVLDRMIWTAARHAVVVPEPFSASTTPPAADEVLSQRRNTMPAPDHERRQLSSAIELRPAARRAA